MDYGFVAFLVLISLSPLLGAAYIQGQLSGLKEAVQATETLLGNAYLQGKLDGHKKALIEVKTGATCRECRGQALSNTEVKLLLSLTHPDKHPDSRKQKAEDGTRLLLEKFYPKKG